VLQREPATQTAVLPPQAEPDQRSRWWIPVLVTLLILGALALVLFLLAQNLLDDEEGQGQLVPVPDVVGDQFNDARRTLEAEGFVVVTPPTRVPQEDFPDEEPSTVVEQDPAANDEVEEGAEVTLTVVEEPGTVTIPTGLTGGDPDEVRLALRRWGSSWARSNRSRATRSPREPSPGSSRRRAPRSSPGTPSRSSSRPVPRSSRCPT
jgi:serine/threonine-protein kinase